MPRRAFRFARLALAFAMGLALPALAGAEGARPDDVGVAEIAPPSGTWEGGIDTPPPLGVVVRLALVDDTWQGEIDIPAQGAFGLPLEGVQVDDDAVRFRIGGLAGEPTFDGTIDGDRIDGTFTQAGQTFSFELERIAAGAETGDGAGDAAAAPAAPGPGPAPVAPEADPTAASDLYEDPDGVFTAPIPSGWTVEERDDHVTFVSPEGDVRLHLLTVETEDLEAAAEEAWARVDDTFDVPVDDVLEPPSSPGVERTLLVNYDSPTGEIQQAIVQLYEGVAHVLLADGTIEGAQRRGSQLDIVLSGYTIVDLEEPDLVGEEPRDVADVIDELEAFVREALEAFGIPGAALAIVQGDDVVHATGFGVRTAGGEPITADTHMMIGSTGKTMTTMLMAALVDEGAFEWDTPVVDVLPEFEVADPEITRSMTMRNLVCACSGVPRRDLELLFNADAMDAEDVVVSLADFEFFTDFGDVFQYSNQLVGTGGFAAAAADGAEWGELWEGYAESLASRILEPIGMDDTTLSFESVVARGEHAQPHGRDIDSGAYVEVPFDVERLLVPIAPAGSHWSTADDMARYLLTQLHAGVTPDGARVVSEEALRTTWEPQVPVTANDSYGLGWFVGEYRGLEMLHHGGNTLGFTSDFAFLPDVGLGVVVLTNAQNSNLFNMAVRTRLFELVYDVPGEAEELVAFGLTQIERMLGDIREDLLDEVDAEAVEPYLGTFASPDLGEITISLENGVLLLDAGEFRTALRPSVDADGEIEHYVAMEGPIATAPFEFALEDEAPVIELGEGLFAYTFRQVE